MSDPILSVHDVTREYSDEGPTVQVLKGVSLDVYRGEVLLLTGPSGSGKTTLLSIMGCLLRPTTGRVIIAGRDIARLREWRLPEVRLKHIGFVFQHANLFPTLTAVENVELSLNLRGNEGRAARREALELLDSVNLAEKANSYPANLSGGQKQRVAIARALAGDPEIIQADEPTAALDSHSGRSVMELLSSLARDRDRAVVIVTHDPRATKYADRIVKMEDGRLISEELCCAR
jgi:putative ABC transport system ATP-binding protein